jgi:hypothetical protein
MKKNGLTTAVIAGIAGVAGVGSIADAVNLNPDGLGQVLIYPYYTTQGGNDTLISVVNTADVAKAVKVRFLEGRNSREVLDFNLYLSPFDVWTAGIFAIPEGSDGFPSAGVLTRDRSCTAPDIVTATPDGDSIGVIGETNYAIFVNYAYAGLDHPASAAATLSSLERTREGYVEMIEMANLTTPASAWVTHNASGIPANCGAVRDAWANGAWPVQSDVAPTGQGQLFGNAMIVNPAAGTIAGYAADAIEGFTFGSLHTVPGSAEPNLGDVNDVGFDPTQATAFVFENGQLLEATYPANAPGGFGRIDAISALYATPRVMNEYYIDGNDTVQSNSEWVVTFPTKRFYVDDSPYIDLFNEVQPSFNPDAPVAPFANAFGAQGSCEGIRVRVWDREERTPQGGGLPFSPPRPGLPQNSLCWEAQVISFGQGDRITDGEGSFILGSTYYNNVNPPFDAGWVSMEFGRAGGGTFTIPAMRPSVEGQVFRGLPVTGFFVANYDNGVSDSGVLANYTGLFRHKTVRDCVVDGVVCS